MNKIIYTLLFLTGLYFITNAKPTITKFALVDSNFDDTSKNNILDSIKFSNQTIDEQLLTISKHSTLENITKGQLLYEAKCQQCHKLYKPEKRNSKNWMNVMKRMAPEANLSDENYRLVCVYLYSKSLSKGAIIDSSEKEETPSFQQQW